MFSVGCHMINPSPGWKCIQAPCVLARDWSCSCSRVYVRASMKSWNHRYLLDLTGPLCCQGHGKIEGLSGAKNCTDHWFPVVSQDQSLVAVCWQQHGAPLNKSSGVPVQETEFSNQDVGEFSPDLLMDIIWYYHVMDWYGQMETFLWMIFCLIVRRSSSSENSRDAVE